MNTLLWLLLACGTNPTPSTPPPPSGAETLGAFLDQLCAASAQAAVPLEGELPDRALAPDPAAAFPRLMVSHTEATWNSMPVDIEEFSRRLSKHEIPSEVVVQVAPSVPSARVAPFVNALREAGVVTVLAAVRSSKPPSVPSPPNAELVTQLQRIPQPHLRMAALQREVDTAVGECGHAKLAFTIANTDTGDRCDVWRRQLAPSLNLCPELSAERLASLTWIMEHPSPESFWATVPVPDTLSTDGTWDDALAP